MLNVKTNPVGIDILIQAYQTALHERLIAAWGLADDQYECYGRCYRNKNDNGYVAEVFKAGIDYQEVYWNDRVSAVSFFGISNEEHGIGENTRIHLVFFVDIKKLKPTINHRADEEVRRDVQLFAAEGFRGFQYKSTELWLENVLREYPGNFRNYGSGDINGKLKFLDMHPTHCFRINLEINYNKNIC